MKSTQVLLGFVVILVLGGLSGHAGESSELKESAPPSTYALADVVFEYDFGSGNNGGVAVKIEGSGKGSRIERDSSDHVRTTEFVVAPKEVFQLLELCYRNRFFELSPSYGPPGYPRLNPDGTVELMMTVVSHTSENRVTLRIGTYSKSVSYSQPLGDPPGLVLEVARRITELEARAVVK